jgi:hypothetical protein
MKKRAIWALLSGAVLLRAVIIDRIAIVVGNDIIKNSDIDRDLRVTDFLNGQPLNLTETARKEAAKRLITQEFIRREIRIGEYPTATPDQADEELKALIAKRYRTQTDFEAALRRYGLTKPELEAYFEWQLTVLDFVSARFKPGVYIVDEQIQKYYQEHARALEREYPGKTRSQLEDVIRNILSGEEVNQQFFAWLDQQRKNAKIQYLEGGLR